MQYKEWLEMWLKNYVTPMRKARTADLYTEIAEKKIIPYLGGYDRAIDGFFRSNCQFLYIYFFNIPKSIDIIALIYIKPLDFFG